MADFKDNKLTYQQLVMRQVKIVQDITAKELRDSTKTIKNFIGEQIVEAEDTRISYLQAVEMFGSLLSPYFKEKSEMEKDFENFCKLNDMELKEGLKDKEFLASVKLIFGEGKEKDEKSLPNINVYFLQCKVKEARKIFRDLVKLFKQNDFLANESYSEGAGSDEGLDADGDDVEGEIEDFEE